MEGRRPGRFLSQEEIELWAHVTRNDAPLTALSPVQPKLETSRPKVAREAPRKPDASEKHLPPKTGHPHRNALASPPPHAPFDPRIGKKIARGRHEIEARLDLHGLRQHDAYVALRRFLARCQADGLRHVLVITGKGGKAEERQGGDFWRTDERGVLRRLVPQWLIEPSFRLHVVSFTESALKHGGSGALYVTIRKGPRHPIHK